MKIIIKFVIIKNLIAAAVDFYQLMLSDNWLAENIIIFIDNLFYFFIKSKFIKNYMKYINDKF